MTDLANSNQKSKPANTFKYAAAGAIAGMVITAGLVTLFTNENARKKLTESQKDNINELKKTLLTPSNRETILTAVSKTLDELKQAIFNFVNKTLQPPQAETKKLPTKD